MHRLSQSGKSYIWVNYNTSLVWNKAILGWFPLLTNDYSEGEQGSVVIQFTQIQRIGLIVVLDYDILWRRSTFLINKPWFTGWWFPYITHY